MPFAFKLIRTHLHAGEADAGSMVKPGGDDESPNYYSRGRHLLEAHAAAGETLRSAIAGLERDQSDAAYERLEEANRQYMQAHEAILRLASRRKPHNGG